MKLISLLLTIIITFLLLFATSFLLDIQLISNNYIRVFLVYLLLIIELLLGVFIFKQLSK